MVRRGSRLAVDLVLADVVHGTSEGPGRDYVDICHVMSLDVYFLGYVEHCYYESEVITELWKIRFDFEARPMLWLRHTFQLPIFRLPRIEVEHRG
jgi:hypothetical protein